MLNAVTSLNIDLNGLFSLADCHVYSKDKSGRYIRCNEAFVEFNQLKSERDVINATDLDLPMLSTESANCFMYNDQKVIKERKSLFLQEIATLQKKSFHFLSIKTPLSDQDKKVIGIFGISCELTNINSKNAAFFSGFNKASRFNLSNRQIECLYHLAKGLQQKQIARLLDISPRTVEHHLENLKQKLKCYSRSDLISKAYEIPEIKIRLLM